MFRIKLPLNCTVLLKSSDKVAQLLLLLQESDANKNDAQFTEGDRITLDIEVKE